MLNITRSEKNLDSLTNATVQPSTSDWGLGIHQASTRFLPTAFITFFLLLAVEAASQSTLYPLTPVPEDVDTIKIDTTGLGLDFEAEWPYDSILYIRNNVVLQLSDSAILPQAFPKDSTVDYEWENIDTAFASVRGAIEHIDTTWGPAVLRKLLPHFDSGERAQKFLLVIPDYVKYQDISQHLDSIENLTIHYRTYHAQLLHIPNDPAFDTRNNFPDLVHSGTVPSHISYGYHDRRGPAWHLFAIQAPLAWEISTGHSTVTLSAADQVYTDWPGATLQSDHPEMPIVSSITETGTYVFNASDDFDGTYKPTGIGVGHGMLITEAIGEINNNSGAGGVCPDCRGYIKHGTSSAVDMILDIDTDFLSNNDIKTADVINMSFASGSMRETLKSVFDNGIVAVAASGNRMMNHRSCECSGSCSSYPSCVTSGYAWGERETTLVTDNGTQYREIAPREIYPAATTIADQSYPSGYIKPIAVGATMLEHVYFDDQEAAPYCSSGAVSRPSCPLSPWDNRGHHFFGNETFVRNFTYSPGTDKFGSTSIDRSEAYIDVVAPTGNYFHAANGLTACSTGTVVSISGFALNCDDPNDLNWYNLRDWRYLSDAWGTSHAAPLVTGIVGLMMSVNPKLGQSGSMVQHRAYDIITMTADKVVDDGRYVGDGEMDNDGNNSDDPDGIECGDYSSTNIKYRNQPPSQPQYVTQADDPLKRSWAQRMGFGRVNAFRAVAHAIPTKGVYSYKTGLTLSPSAASNGRKLMHFGWWVGNDGTNDISLYDYNNASYDGHDLPGAATSHNNQGKTELDGTSITLQLDTDVILAIDGILTSSAAPGSNKIITGTTGKACIAGLLENVQISGNLRTGDLIIDASSSGVPLLLASGSSATIEVYGTLQAENYGYLRVENDAALTIQPNSHIKLNGSENIEITDGATALVRNGTSLVSTSSSVVVGSGSELRIESGAFSELDLPVVVENGGKFIISENAEALVRYLSVERGGEVLVEAGATLTLTDEAAPNYIEGRLRVMGTPGNLATVRALTEDCCLPGCNEVVGTARILVEDDLSNIADLSSSLVEIDYGWFEDVSLSIVHAPVKAISNSTFVATRSRWQNSARMVSFHSRHPDVVGVDYVHPTGGGSITSRMKIVIDGCTFLDLDGEVSSPGVDLYGLIGIWNNGTRRLEVSESHFENLKVGIAGMKGDVLRVEESTFRESHVGVLGRNPVLSLCYNDFIKTRFGVANSGGVSGTYFDNFFSEVRIGAALTSLTAQYFRGNTFDNYLHGGISLNETTARLDEGVAGWPNFNYYWGRNKFLDDGMAMYFGTPLTQSDIILKTNRSFAQLECGYNLFYSASTYNLWSDVAVTINASNNNFAPTGTPATFNVTVTGSPLNVADVLSGCGLFSGTHCGTTPNPIPFGTGLNPIWVSHGLWYELPVGSTFLDSAFQFSLVELQNTGLGYRARIRKISDSYESAILGDSIETNLSVLSSVLAAIESNSSENIELRAEAGLILSEIQGRLFGEESADSVMQTMLATYTRDVDTSLARWNASFYLADTTASTSLADSLHDDAVTRVVDDIKRWSDLPGGAIKPETPSSPQSGAGTADISAVEFLPNPARGKTIIRTILPHNVSEAALRIFDVSGIEIGSHALGRLSAGRTDIPFNFGDMSRGTYLIILEFESGSVAGFLHVTQ